MRGSFLSPEGWEALLPRNDVDFEFILQGVLQGFHIVDSLGFVPVETNNYASATGKHAKGLVECQIRTEIREGRYVRVVTKPPIISALGSIPKADGKVHLIHDASRPSGQALNDYAQGDQKLRFQTIEEATDMLSPGAFLAKVDLKSAYRSVRVHPSNWPACGLKWQFEGEAQPTYLVDTALPFGSKWAPKIFHRLTQAVRRMMARRGFQNVVAYLDDFLIVEPTQARCLLAQNTLISVLRTLGFSIAWEKVEGPTKSLIFLGVQIDTDRACLELPSKKLQEFRDLIKDALSRSRMNLRQLQVLAGKLNWASAVVRGGRAYLRRVLDAMRPLRVAHHKIRIPEDMRDDLRWWDEFLVVFNGVRWFRPTSHWPNVYVDASLRGGGMAWQGDWAFIDWSSETPALAEAHINIKEIMVITMAVRRWAPFWRNASVTIHTDNMTAKAAVNKGTVRCKSAMAFVREIFWWATLFGFKIKAVHIPGVRNTLADAISRLHCVPSFSVLKTFLHLRVFPDLHCMMQLLLSHMSLKSFLSILPQVCAVCQN